MIYNIFLTQSPKSLTIYCEGEGKKRQGVSPFAACFNPFQLTEYVVSAFQLFKLVIGEYCSAAKMKNNQNLTHSRPISCPRRTKQNINLRMVLNSGVSHSHLSCLMLSLSLTLFSSIFRDSVPLDTNSVLSVELAAKVGFLFTVQSWPLLLPPPPLGTPPRGPPSVPPSAGLCTPGKCPDWPRSA